LSLAFTLISWLAYSVLKMEAVCSPKSRSIFNGIHDVISHKIVLCITSVVRTINPTHCGKVLNEMYMVPGIPNYLKFCVPHVVGEKAYK
jgi:hypothetical protein